ncbi:MAG: calcineurin-like phosphoesterase C-terminal domain-containing protein [Pseudomonadales bacterium]|nr:calcineurin-like phosphoesterase C-terminal domain-containing protein [Pseudomonadales bacterium]
MKQPALLCFPVFLLFAAQHGLAQCGLPGPHETARGTVFVDRDNDGLFSAGETGVEEVAVSNGCEVVLTDTDGRYEIPIAANEILFISKPAAYSLAVDEFNVPRFFYRHYPEGTPAAIAGTAVEWLFPVVEATGALPRSIDFPLYRSSDSSEFKAHGFADTQARYESSQDMLREDLINPLIGNPHSVDFGLTVGDVVYDNLAIYPRHKAMMALMDIPQWYLPGNHDINFESPDAWYANETYKRHFGPTYYSFNHGNVHFVALNNVEYAGNGRDIDGNSYRGYIPEHQLQWLAADLSHVPSDKLIVIASHIPLIAEASDGRNPPASGPNTGNFQALLEILEPFQHIYGLAGHDTSNSWKVQVDHSHGWGGLPWIAHTLAEVRGNGWTRGPADLRGVRDAMMEDGNPNGYYVLHFNDTELVPEFVPFPFGSDAGQRLRITLDPGLKPDGDSINRGQLQPDTHIVVNLFDGGARDKVWLSLDGAAPVAMQYTVRTDPFVERSHARFANSDDAYGTARRSSHIWQWPLPDTLQAGLHSVVVTSEDEFGQTRRGSFSFELLPTNH